MRWFLLILMGLMLVSCSHSPSTSSQGDNYQSLSGEIGPHENEEPTSPPTTIEVLPNESRGPIKQKRLPTVAVFLGPGLYNAFAYVELLKAIEKASIKISSISGSELGLYVASLYAKYGKAAHVEWHLFKLLPQLEELRDYPLYDEQWRRFFQSYLDREFKGLNFEQLKIPLLAPAYGVSQKRPFTFQKGPLLPVLRTMLFPFPQEGLKFISPLGYQVLFPEDLKRRGADIVITVHALSRSHKGGPLHDKALIPFYQDVQKRLRKEESRLSYSYNLNEKGRLPDHIDEMLSYQGQVAKTSEGIVKKLKQVMARW